MRHLFITGGAGFIGSALVRHVLDAFPDAIVTNFDALTYAGNRDNLQGVDERRHRFVHGDIADRAAVRAALMEGADAILHLAAESHVDRSIAGADAFIRTNVLGTQILLDAAREFGVARFVHVSTDEVLGSLPDDDSAFFQDASPYQPNSPYAASKAGAEHLVRAAHQTFGLDVRITRCGNNYGPRQYPEKLIPLTIAKAMRDTPIPVYGDGRNVRDWIHVDDHCRAILAVLARGASGGVYHIGARNPRRNIDVVHEVLAHLGKPASLIEFVADRLGHDRRYAIDPSRTERDLNWQAREDWKTGILATIRWYQTNQAWIARLNSAV